MARAAIESLAENFSDGVVAPAFWFLLLGLPGAVVYKAINTANSMIGHRTPRHEAFGWAAARLDDLVNLPASRLSALFHRRRRGASSPGCDPKAAWRTALRDAPRHRSPNAGWPEAAMAGALGPAAQRAQDLWRRRGSRMRRWARAAPRPGPTISAERSRLFRVAGLVQLAVIAGLAALGLFT